MSKNFNPLNSGKKGLTPTLAERSQISSLENSTHENSTLELLTLLAK
jgi:hypothetical protein